MKGVELTPEEEYKQGIRQDNLLFYGYLAICFGSFVAYFVILLLMWMGI